MSSAEVIHSMFIQEITELLLWGQLLDNKMQTVLVLLDRKWQTPNPERRGRGVKECGAREAAVFGTYQWMQHLCWILIHEKEGKEKETLHIEKAANAKRQHCWLKQLYIKMAKLRIET